MSECPICDSVGACVRGEHPSFIAALAESFCVLGDNQGCPGWCVLILKDHHEHLGELPLDRQQRLWGDVAQVAAAQRAVFGRVRINYECLGNVVPHIHWHLIPRHHDDPEPKSPVWGWPMERLRGTAAASERLETARRIRVALNDLHV